MTFSFSHLIFCTLDWTGLKFLTQCPLKAGAGHNCRFIKNICCLSCTWLKSLLVATLLQHRLCIGKSFVSWHASWSQQPSWRVQTHKNIHTAASNWHQVELLIRLLVLGCLASTTAVILFHNISYFRWIINWEWWLWCWLVLVDCSQSEKWDLWNESYPIN